MYRCLLLLPVVSFLAPVAGSAQETHQAVGPGERVRVIAPSLGVPSQVATFVAIDSVDLRIRPANSGMSLSNGAWWEFDGRDSIIVLPRVSTRLEVWGERNRFQEGTVIGILLGGALGLAIGRPYRECVRREWLFDSCIEWRTVDAEYVPIVAATAGGTLLGAIIGSQLKTLGWRKVNLDELAVSFVPLRDGFRFGASVRF